jgi:hypothetical protein
MYLCGRGNRVQPHTLPRGEREINVQPDDQGPFIRIVEVQYFAISERYLKRLDDDLIREFGRCPS